MTFKLIKMAPGYRMVRIGIGQFDRYWFFRADFWWYGIRISQKDEEIY